MGDDDERQYFTDNTHTRHTKTDRLASIPRTKGWVCVCVCVGGRVLPRKAAEIGIRRQRKKGGCRGDKVGDWVTG